MSIAVMALAPVYTLLTSIRIHLKPHSLSQVTLIELLHTLQTVQQTHHLKDPRNGIRKLKNSYESLSAVVDLWWSWVDHCLVAQGCELNVVNWVKEQLLPAVYWQQQVRRTKNPDPRA